MANKKVALDDLLGPDSSFSNMSTEDKAYLTKILQAEAERRRGESECIQIRPIEPIEKWVESEYFVGPDVVGIYDYWKEFVINIFRTDRKPEEKINQVILGGCLTANERVAMADGRFLTIPEIMSEYGPGGTFDIFSALPSGAVIVGKGRFAHKTKSNAELVRVCLDNGQYVDCTPDHKFMLQSGHYRRADKLQQGEVLMSSEQRIAVREVQKLDNREDVYDIEVEQYHNFLLSSGIFVHNSIGTGKSCLHWNTRIPTSIGILSLRELSEAFKSGLTFQVMAESGLKDVLDVYDNGEDDTYILHMASGKVIECTEHHKFRVWRRGANEWVEAQYLCKDDKFLVKYRKNPTGSETFTKEQLAAWGKAVRTEGINPAIWKANFTDIRTFLKASQSKLKNTNPDPTDLRISVPASPAPDMATALALMDLYSTVGSKVRLDKERMAVIVDDFTRVSNEGYEGFDYVVDITRGRAHTMDLTVSEDHSYCFLGYVSHNTVAELIMLRKLYEMSCYKNINSMYGLMSKTSIMFLYFSVNKTQAERTGFGEIRQWIDSSPYFNECFTRNKRLKEALIFPEGLTFVYGSGSQHSIGMSVIGTILDEANFRGTGSNAASGAGDAEKAGELYAGIINRANSRFVVSGGTNHSLNILISSSTYESSFTEKQIARCKDDPHTLIAVPSQWEVKPDKFGKKRFWVCRGSDYLEPFIVDNVGDITRFRLAEGMSKCKSGDALEGFEDIHKEVKALPPHLADKFIQVPSDLRLNFDTNILKSLQDLAGVSIGSFGKLFTSVTVYNDAIKPGFEHPFVSESISVSTGDDIKIEDYLKRNFRLRHPERPRYLHIDQSVTTDCTGISSVYVDEVVEADGVKKTYLGVDFMLRIVPPKPPRRLALYKIRNFVIYLSQVIKMSIGVLTYDTFNSEESKQILQEQGYNVKNQSVDRTDKAYVDLVTILYEGRLRMYNYEPFRKELFNLQHDRGRRKVDHPKSNDDGTVGTKDVADSLAGAVENALSVTIDTSSAYRGSINDFVVANSFQKYEFDPTSAESAIDREIDRIIETMESEAGHFDNFW